MQVSRTLSRNRVSLIGSLAAILVLTGASFADAASSSSSSSRSSSASRSGSASSLGRAGPAGRAAVMRHAKTANQRSMAARGLGKGAKNAGSTVQMIGAGNAAPGGMGGAMMAGPGGQPSGGGAAIRMRSIRPELPSTMLFSPGSQRRTTRPGVEPGSLIQSPLPDPDTCTSSSSPACDETQRNQGARAESSLSAGSAESSTLPITTAPGLPPVNEQTQNPLSSLTNSQSPLVNASGSGGSSRPDGGGAAGATLADCMKIWEPATHMTTSEWRAACIRTQDGNRLLSPNVAPSMLAETPRGEPRTKTSARRIREASANGRRQR